MCSRPDTLVTGSKPVSFRAASAGAVARATRDLLFPDLCRLCGAEAESLSGEFCAECGPFVAAERGEASCRRCAQSLSNAGAPCRECADEPGVLDGLVRAGPYGPALGRLLRGFKYNGREELGPLLGRWLAEAAARADWIDRVDVVTWIPTHWRTRLRRPVHAAEVFADHVARALGIRARPLLRRTCAGRHQVGLTYTQRLANVRGLYEAGPRSVRHGSRILIVDDVRTTGATLDHCARVLRRAGAAEVYGAVALKVTWAVGPTGAPLMV